MAIPRPLAAPALLFDRLVICMRASIWRQLLVLYTVTMPATAAAPSDRTDATLARCLDAPVNASTAGQTDCETRAKQAWDRRMSTAYATLMKRLTADAAHRLRLSQRAWLAFRDADAQARASFFASRRGTMYVPMQAASETAVTRDRAVQLEAWVHVYEIDG